MKELLLKLGISIDLQGDELAAVLESEKQKTLRRYNNVFGNPVKEMELSLRLKTIEDAQAKLSNQYKLNTEAADTTGLTEKQATFSFNDVSFVPKESKQTEKPKPYDPTTADDLYTRALEEYQNKDYDNAVRLFVEAALKGSVEAMYIAALLYDEGFAEQDNYSVSLKWFAEASKQNHANATYDLGRYYMHGKGVEQDINKAIELFEKAANLGSIYAMCTLGNMYREGDGIKQSDEEAFHWYRKAMETGLDDCYDVLYYLGIYYEEGLVTEQSYSNAYEMYERASEEGIAEASYAIALMYELGKGIPKSNEDAFRWYQKGAEQGSAKAQYNLGCMYYSGEGTKKDLETAVKWFHKAAEQGIAPAQYNLAKCFENGYGITKNPFKAFNWYLKSAEQGNEKAQYIVADAYEKGNAVGKDYLKAVKWYQKSASNGFAPARDWLDNNNIVFEDGDENDESACIYRHTDEGDVQIYGNLDSSVSGSGKIVYISGEKMGCWYEGTIKNGQFNGQGVYHLNDTVISGDFKDGVNGNLKCTLNNKVIYEGEYRNGKKHGMGVYYNDDGSGFQGEFENDKACNGQGSIIFTRSDGVQIKSIGKFANGEIIGNGRYLILSGSQKGSYYEGYCQNGQYHGQGTYYNAANGLRIIGVFQGGLTGTVKVVNNEGFIVYEGEIKNAQYHGHGVKYGNDGTNIKGEWDSGKLVRGNGTYLYKNSNGIIVRDVGLFENGQLSGLGKRYILSGTDKGGRWEGNFTNGALNGFCTFYNSMGGRNEAQLVNGVFHGIVKVYSAVGVLCYETVFSNGKEVGPRKESYLYRRSQGRY